MWHVQVAVLPLLLPLPPPPPPPPLPLLPLPLPLLPLLPLFLTTLLLIFSSPVLAFLLTVFTIFYDKKKGGLLNASAGKHAGGVEGHWSVLVVAEVVAVALMMTS